MHELKSSQHGNSIYRVVAKDAKEIFNSRHLSDGSSALLRDLRALAVSGFWFRLVRVRKIWDDWWI